MMDIAPILRAVASVCLLCTAAAAAAASLTDLDDRFQLEADGFYRALARKQPQSPAESLQAYSKALAAADPVSAGAIVRANQTLLQAHYQSAAFRDALVRSYALNDTATVREFTRFIDAKGDPVAIADNYFALAKYYYARGNWPGVAAALSQVDGKQLDVSDAQYAELLRGYALQAQKKHRKAMTHYRQIPASSTYYPYLKLNLGTAYLRQGWWTDAHAEFKAALAAAAGNPELQNRIRVTLGFSQIHNEFYRDARKTLRKVPLGTALTNKALLGLGVAAAFEGDYAGAENAFARLTEEASVVQNVDEAYLLLAQVRAERHGANAAQSFRAAIGHFEQRLTELSEARQALADAVAASALDLIARFDARAQQLYAGSVSPLPQYARDNYRHLLDMTERAARLDLPVDLGGFLNEFDAALKAQMDDSLAQRESVLQSYLSQAKLGVAKLYDAP